MHFDISDTTAISPHVPKHAKIEHVSDGDEENIPDNVPNETRGSDSALRAEISSLHEDIPRIVQYELDKHGLLIRLSIILSLIVLLIGGATVTTSCIHACVDGIGRGKRIKYLESNAKIHSTVSPALVRFTQSRGDPETDLESNLVAYNN